MEEGLKKDDFNVDSYCFKFIYPVALTKSEVEFLVDNDKLKLKTNFNQDWELTFLGTFGSILSPTGYQSKDTSFLTMKDWVKLIIIVVIGASLTAKLGLLF